MTLQDWLQASGINYQAGESAGQPGVYTNAQGMPLWDAANPMYGGISKGADESPEQYMQRIYAAGTDPSYGSAGLNYGDLSSGTGFFSNAARDNGWMRVGNNLGDFANDPLAMNIINQNGGMSALSRFDPTYGNEFNVSSPQGLNAYQQLSDLGDKRHNTLNDQGWFNLLKLAAMAAGGAYAGAAGGAADAGGSAVATGAGSEAGGAIGGSLGEAGGQVGGQAGGSAMDFGSSGLTEGDLLASESNFVPGSFDLGASSYGGSAAAGLDLSAADAAGGSSFWQQIAQKFGTTAAQQLLKSATGSSGSPLGNIFGGNGGAQDWMSLLGSLGSAGLGYFGAQNQANNYNALQQKYLDMGQPYRDRLNASYQPGFDMAQADPAYQGAMDQSSNSILRKLSATGGNPYDNPGGLMEAQKYVTQNVALPQLNTYRSQLGGFGQLGINTAGTAGMNSVPAESGKYTALGSGLAGLTNPYGNMRLNLGGGY